MSRLSRISVLAKPAPLLAYRAGTVRAGRRTLELLAATAVLLGFSAVAMAGVAQAQTEVLAGTATTTSGSWYCIGGGVGQSRGAGAAFQASGTATGPYPGSFTETGTASLRGNYGPFGRGSLHMTFAIMSDTTTITGTITQSHLFGGVYCGGSIGFNTSSATYTAMIQAPGKTAQTISGTAQVSGSLSTQRGAQTPLTATLALP